MDLPIPPGVLGGGSRMRTVVGDASCFLFAFVQPLLYQSDAFVHNIRPCDLHPPCTFVQNLHFFCAHADLQPLILSGVAFRWSSCTGTHCITSLLYCHKHILCKHISQPFFIPPPVTPPETAV